MHERMVDRTDAWMYACMHALAWKWEGVGSLSSPDALLSREQEAPELRLLFAAEAEASELSWATDFCNACM